MIDPRQLIAAQRLVDLRERADPLSRYEFASPHHREVVRAVNARIEAHHRAANWGGKTQNIAAWCIAFMQGRGELGGEPMPIAGRPVAGAVLVSTQDQQKDSSQKALRDWLGDWPHFEAMADRGKDIVSTLWVRPKGHRSDDCSTWSRLTFVPQGGGNPASIKGQRWDFVWGDEPPVEDFWREARKNSLDYRVITETPLDIGEWDWIQRDFVGTIGQGAQGRIEIVSSLDDNRFLAPEKRVEFENLYRGDKFYRARRFGEYVDASGDCPFPYERLEKLLRWAEDGQPWDGDPRLETWRDLEAHEDYMVICDPSAGIRPSGGSDGGNRCVLWVIAVRARAGVARFYGHLPPNRLAEMALKAARYYNTALLVPEVNGLGEAMLPVFEGYPRIYREYALERVDQSLSGRLGWYQSEQTKAAAVGSLITALDPANGWLDIPSADAVRSLMAIRMDQRGKLMRKPNQNHEDMIALGMGAYLLQHPSYAAPELRDERALKPSEKFEKMLAEGSGLKYQRRHPVSVPRDRWR